MNDTVKQEFTMRIANSNRSGLVVILYEMLFVYLDDAQTALQEKNQEELKLQIRHADAVLKELCDSLNFKYELSAELYSIYTYCRKNLARVIYALCADGIEETRTQMQTLYEAFCEVHDQDASEPVMQHTQKVYAGMTYGKGDLNENIQDPDAGRGFFA